MNQEAERIRLRSELEEQIRMKLYEVGEEAGRLTEMDGIGMMNECHGLKSLVGQFESLIGEFRRRL